MRRGGRGTSVLPGSSRGFGGVGRVRRALAMAVGVHFVPLGDGLELLSSAVACPLRSDRCLQWVRHRGAVQRTGTEGW